MEEAGRPKREKQRGLLALSSGHCWVSLPKSTSFKQMRELRLREVRGLGRGHSGSWHSCVQHLCSDFRQCYS